MDKLLKAYRAWRRAAERGYPPRCNNIAEMRRVDDRIRRLKSAYETIAAQRKANQNV